jgi:hypothetical protein
VYGDNPLMRDRLVLKGGNAFRKGYFVNTRFSGDLDFAAPAGLHPVQLLDALNYACRMVQGRTGVEFDLDRNAQTGQRSIDSTKTLHKFTLYFKGLLRQSQHDDHRAAHGRHRIRPPLPADPAAQAHPPLLRPG